MNTPGSKRWLGLALLFLSAVATTLVQPLCLRAQESEPTPAGQPAAVPSLPKGKRLYMKDGSYQLARSYEIQGERVRYYSVERSAWEEIPTALVDWDATKKAETEETQHEQALIEKVRAAAAAERAAPVDVDASIEAAPGVFLPPGEGVFVLDGKAVFPLIQAEAGVKTDKGRVLKQILVPVPLVPSRRIVQVRGKSATFRIANAQPEFYMRTADAREPEMELIRAKVSGDARQIEFIDVLFKQPKAQRKTLPLVRWQVAKGVYRFTLGQPLEPGEYALAEIVPKEGMDLFVWDFGIDPPTAKPSPK